MAAPTASDFSLRVREDAELNQYWFSPHTIELLVAEATSAPPSGLLAFVSSPSVFFSVPPTVRQRSVLLEFDQQWATEEGFVSYDFHKPAELPSRLKGACSFVLIDPPFITRDVWECYAQTAHFLLAEGGLCLCASIMENSGLLKDLLGVRPKRFRPSIPNLVYQYHLFASYESERLDAANVEVDPDGDVPMPGQSS